MTPYERIHLAAQGYFELGMLEEALHQLNSLSPGEQLRPEALELRVLVQMKASRWREALTASERLCALAPQAPIGFIHAAFCLHELGRTREARDLLLEGPPSLASEATYHYNLACYECALGNLETARAYLQTSISLDAKLRAYARVDPDLRPLQLRKSLPIRRKKK